MNKNSKKSAAPTGGPQSAGGNSSPQVAQFAPGVVTD